MDQRNAVEPTSGTSALSVFAKISHSTSTGVSGFNAMPACIFCAWIYLISSFGLVVRSEWSAGFSAAVEATAAS